MILYANIVLFYFFIFTVKRHFVSRKIYQKEKKLSFVWSFLFFFFILKRTQTKCPSNCQWFYITYITQQYSLTYSSYTYKHIESEVALLSLDQIPLTTVKQFLNIHICCLFTLLLYFYLIFCCFHLLLALLVIVFFLSLDECHLHMVVVVAIHTLQSVNKWK